MAIQNGYLTKCMKNVRFPEMQTVTKMLQPIMKALAQPAH